jgi:hypothetical protein
MDLWGEWVVLGVFRVRKDQIWMNLWGMRKQPWEWAETQVFGKMSIPKIHLMIFLRLFLQNTA